MPLPKTSLRVNELADVFDHNMIVDFKTADKSYSAADVHLSDQLTTYELGGAGC